MNGILEQVRTYYQALQPGQQRIVVAALALAVLAVISVGVWSSQPHTTPLLTTDPTSAQSVIDSLEQDGIAYEVSGDGRTVSVAPQDEGRARISAAKAGQIVGFEVLDQVELGTSPYRERAAYQRGLQGELARTISGLDEVVSARVHVVMPERSPFFRDERSPSSSVTITLVPGASLSKGQTLGITALVAGAVDGLKPSDVVLIDHEGNLLSGGQGDGALAGIDTLFEVQRAAEVRTQSAIESALLKVLGSRDDMSVAVTVELETTATDELEQRVDPDETVLVSESIREEQTEASRPTGIPGAESNLPEQGGPNQQAQTQNSNVNETRGNYEHSRTEKRATRAPGTISRVSASVNINESRVSELAKAALLAQGVDEPEADVLAEREKQIKDLIEQSVRSAMGFDANRKDAVAVAFLPFSADNGVDSADLAENSSVFPESLQAWTLLLAAVVLFFLFVIRPLVGAVSKAAQPPLPPALDPVAADAADALRAAADGTGSIDMLDPNDPAAREAGRNLTERLRSMVDNFENVDAADLNRLVDLEREATAQVLRRWIREG